MKLIKSLFFVWILVVLSVMGGLGYVILHFLSKFW